MLSTDMEENNYSKLISIYIEKKIVKEVELAKNESSCGKFILRDYDNNILNDLLNLLKNKPGLLILIDKNLNLPFESKNSNHITPEAMAQYRNESVKDLDFDPSEYFFYLFITYQTIDTLNDLATLTYDDIRKDFDSLIDLIETDNLLNKENLKLAVSSLWKEAEELSEIQMAKFISNVLLNTNSYPLEEAMGLSLYSFDMFKCKNFFDLLKNSTNYSKDLKKVIKNFKRINEAFSKKISGNSIENDFLKEKFNENADEFITINSKETNDLIKKFIISNSKEILLNKDIFNKLDWFENSVYKLFEKEKTSSSSDLGSDTINLLKSKDENLTKDEESVLKKYDKSKSSERESLKPELEDIYQKYRTSIEEEISIRNKWGKFLFPQQIKSDNFIIALINTIKKLNDDKNKKIDTIEVKLKYSQTHAIRKNYSKQALFYLGRRYSILNRISAKIYFDFSFIKEIEEEFLTLDNKSNSTKNKKLKEALEKFDRGSSAKSQNEINFHVLAKDKKGEILDKKMFIWSYNPNSMLNGFKDDIDSIIENLEKSKKLFNSNVFLSTNSEKGESKSLSLFDYSSLKSRGQNQGHRLFPKSEKSLGKFNSKKIMDSAKLILNENDFSIFKEFFYKFQDSYLKLLYSLDVKNNITKSNFDFNLVQDLINDYTNLCEYLQKVCNEDKFKNEVIEPFLSLLIVEIDSRDSIIIPSFHPLRLISYFSKTKYIFNFMDKFLTSDFNLINDELFFSDLEHNIETVYYPEIFRLFNKGNESESFLQILEVLDDYSILEPIKNFLDYGQTSDPTEQALILTKLIENYLDLNKHKRNSIKILLHAINNYNFPLKLMQKLSILDNSKKPNNVEIYLNDIDPSKVRKLYRTFLINQNSSDNEELLEDNEVSFLSNVRLNAFEKNFVQLQSINDQINISYLNDFVSTKSKITFTKKICNEKIDTLEYNPLLWTKRRYITKKENSIGKYLITPIDCPLTNSFYNLLFLTFATSSKDQYLNHIPALMIDRNRHDLKDELSLLHDHSDWVVNLDSLVDKRILEEFGANVIKYRKARHINRNLVVSSKANTILLKSFLKAKIESLNIRLDDLENIVESIINSVNELSGDIILKAIGQGKFTNELLGLVLTKTIFEKFTNKNCILIYLDDYSDWFFKKINSEDKLAIFTQNNLADIISITPVFDRELLTDIYLDIIEIKYCNDNTSRELAKKSYTQVKNTFEMISKVFSDNQFDDKEYWVSKISDLIVETHNKGFDNNLTTENIRNAIRNNKSINYTVRGSSFVFVYDSEITQEYTYSSINQYFIGMKEISNILNNITSYKFDLNLPNFFESKIISKKEMSKINLEIESSEKNETKVKDESEKVVLDKKEDLSDYLNKTIQDIKNVVIHHKHKAVVKGTKFTPNSLRVSLEPELGWKTKIFEDMSTDFLTVKGLDLLRVEPVKGSYDLVFKREKREIVKYEDCIKNRELSEGFGNTKIILGKDEKDNSIVYYNLNSEDPHALIGGMTKSGKSVLLNVFIVDLINSNTPEELKLILIDPKQVEFTRYKKIPYLDSDGIINTKEAAMEKLESIVAEMERRYSLFSVLSVNEINKYNTISEKKMHRIVVIFDEFADWMLDDEFKKVASYSVQRLSGKARAAGIHLIISTQRPDNSVVIPILRANLGAKLALRVDSEKNSQIILDEAGAEKLLGYGHMIAKFAGEKRYIQTAFISDEYIDNLLKNKG